MGHFGAFVFSLFFLSLLFPDSSGAPSRRSLSGETWTPDICSCAITDMRNRKIKGGVR